MMNKTKVSLMKFSLAFVIPFIFIGCLTKIPYSRVANPDQRILFEGLSFYPPSGKNWKIRSQPMGGHYTHETFGRALGKIWPFKKRIAGQNQTSDKEEIVFAAVFIHEFSIINFNNDDLMEFSRERYKIANEPEGLVRMAPPLRHSQVYRFEQWFNESKDILNRGRSYVTLNTLPPRTLLPLTSNSSEPHLYFPLESNLSLEQFKGMNCVKKDGKEQIDRWEQSAWVRVIIYSQGYSCVHPRHPNHIIQLYAAQKVTNNQPPTDIQNELDHFFNSLEVLE